MCASLLLGFYQILRAVVRSLQSDEAGLGQAHEGVQRSPDHPYWGRRLYPS